MGIPWYILALPMLAHSVLGIQLVIGESELLLNLTSADNTYTMYLKEDNHVIGADNLTLFSITNVSTRPTIAFIAGNTFLYQLEQQSNSQYDFLANQFFDYETQANTYQVKIDDADSFVVVLMNIVNIDDEPPTLTSPMCSMKENVDYDLANTECNCTLSDPDGWLNKVTFKVINSNPNAVTDLDMEDKLFHFDFDRTIPDDQYEVTVYITTLKTLDYETKIFYSFGVQAKDGAGHSTTPKDTVTSIVDVVDQNDQPPEWSDYFTTQQISEETAHSFNVKAVDGDKGINSEIKYSLISFDENVCGEDPCVSIATEDGKGIITVKPIDRDVMDLTTYKFEIMAQETDDPPFTNNITITFFIEDLDDNSPLVMSLTTTNSTNITYTDKETKIAEFTFYENFALTIDGEIAIKDIDTGINAQFNVELKDEDSSEVTYTDAFLVVPTAGYKTGDYQITVKDSSYLDFENEPWQHFQFYVHSYGFENNTKEDQLLVKIHLLDYNDEDPKFENSSYTNTVDETIKKGEEVIQVKATDKDAEDDILTHKLVGAEVIINLLSIDAAEGIITVAADNAFDYDRINPIVFQVEAIDHANHVTTVPVTINLRDINNKAPTYIVDDVIQVEENQIIGTVLNANITASDVDTTRDLTAEIDWDKSYVTKNSQRLNSSNEIIGDAMQFLDLSFETKSDGTIKITLTAKGNDSHNITRPDYETFDTLYLFVTVTDLNTKLPEFADKMTVDARIVINILDVNDNPPVFTEDTLKKNRTVYEISKAETIVGTIEATDADIGNTVTYSCTYINQTHDWFECSSDGVITVTNSDEIDCDTDAILNVNINCEATDGTFITSQEFSIFIRDRNNKRPQIMVNDTLPSASIVEVYEKSAQNTIVSNIGYTDADRDVPFHTAVCSFQDSTSECYQQFLITNNVITVRNGDTQLNRDEGTDSYDCTVFCVDNPQNDEGEPQNNNETLFTIKLLDINDHCPELQTTELTTNENTMKDALVGLVVGKDIDEGLNAAINISILTVTRDDGTDFTEESLFDMVKDDDDYRINDSLKQWHLTAKKDLPDFYGIYTLQLELKDLGNPPQSTEDDKNKELKEHSKVTVTVSKYNFYSPKFIFPSNDMTFTLISDQVNGKQLVLFTNNEKLENINITTGADETCIEKWVPTFDVALTDENSKLENFFVVKTISKCIAQLQVGENYQKGQNSYKLTLTAKLSNDTPTSGELPYTESIQLTINFVDPEGYPVFNTSDPWNITMREDYIPLTEPLPENRTAYYPNLSNVTVFYSLFSTDTDINNTFDIESNTGNVELKQKLDYLEKSYYEFQILAARNETPVQEPETNSLLSVTLWVEDVNDHTPQWTQESFSGAIMNSNSIGTIIVTALATDEDTMDQNNLKYTLNSTVTPTGSTSIHNLQDPFVVEETTGDIKLNFKADYSMEGYFLFWVSVEDGTDRFGNGPHYNRTTVLVYIVTTDNTITFKFGNNLDKVSDNKEMINKVISEALNLNCHDYNCERDSKNGTVSDNTTACSIYCMDNDTLLTSSDIKSKLNNLNTFNTIRDALLESGILLLAFDDNTTSAKNLETSLKTALIVVSVVLGALCVILAVTFFLKARELNRRLKHLTEPKFGSDESNINRKGVNAPNTNIFAVEGSNPVFNEIKRDDYLEFDKRSISSGDSDLIGVEDSPEFNGMFTADSGKEKF